MEVWLGRSSNSNRNELTFFTCKPYKINGFWYSNECNFHKYDDSDGIFDHVKWSDVEPTKVKLKLERFVNMKDVIIDHKGKVKPVEPQQHMGGSG